MSFLIDFILHIDAHLENIVNTFGNWTYLIVFSIIFIETGAVIMPFLPGDSLLFAASALAASPKYNLNIWYFVILFFIASVVGDSLNFYLGKTVGKAMTNHSFFGRFIKKENIEKTEAFFEKHGGIAIALARFMPIIRTLSPFVCGGSGVKYSSFIKYNLIGATAWVVICCGAGFFFGNIPFVKEHFSMVIIGIIGVSLLPAIIGAIKSKLSK